MLPPCGRSAAAGTSARYQSQKRTVPGCCCRCGTARSARRQSGFRKLLRNQSAPTWSRASAGARQNASTSRSGPAGQPPPGSAIGSHASWRNLTVNVVRSLDRSVTGLLFDIAERHAQGFPVLESALTVMAMISGAAAASADLDSLDRDLRRAPAPVVADGAQPAHGAPDGARDSGGVAGGRHVPARRAGDPRGSGESRRVRISRLGEMEIGVR